MRGINTYGNFEDILSDENLLITKENLKNKCKIGQGSRTCKYIVMGRKGFICGKNTKFKEMLDTAAKKKQVVAISDNCKGL